MTKPVWRAFVTLLSLLQVYQSRGIDMTEPGETSNLFYDMNDIDFDRNNLFACQSKLRSGSLIFALQMIKEELAETGIELTLQHHTKDFQYSPLEARNRVVADPSDFHEPTEHNLRLDQERSLQWMRARDCENSFVFHLFFVVAFLKLTAYT